MARAADGFGSAGLASLLLHGGAALAILTGLPKPSVTPPAQVIEMSFLPAADAAPAAEAPREEAAEPTSELTLAKPVADSVAETMESATSESFPEADALQEASAAPASEAPASEAPSSEASVSEGPAEAEAPPIPPEPTQAAAPHPEAPPPPRPVTAAPRPRAAPRGPRLAAPVSAPATGPAAPAPAAIPNAPPAPPRAAPQSYIAALFAALDRRKEYPEAARWRRAEGVAILRVLLRRDGSVHAWRIERGTGHEDLDQAVGNMVRRASPLPAPPADLPGDPVEFSVPVRFSLR